MDEQVKQTIPNLPNTVERLKTIGTISYAGALLCIIAALIKDFSGLNLLIAGVALLIFTGLIHLKEALGRAANRRAALTTLEEVYKRLSEQTTNGSDKQTVSITQTIDNLPKRVLEVLEKL